MNDRERTGPTDRWAPTVARFVWDALGRYGDRPCIVDEGRTLSYAEVRARVGAKAVWLQRNAPPLGHVGILLRNSQAYVEWMLACACAGSVRVPLNVLDPQDVQEFKLEHGAIDVLVTTEEWREALDRLPPAVVCVDDPRYEGWFADVAGEPSIRVAPDRYRLSYTGGTTGTPKAVVETDIQELAMMRNLLMEVCRPRLGTVYVAATPMSHAAGAFVVPAILGGGAVGWTERFDPERLLDRRWLGEVDDVETFLVPTALATLAEAARGTEAPPRVIYGGAPCPTATLEAATDRFGGRLVQVYGQAEAPMTIAVLKEEDHLDPTAIAGVAGRPFMYVDIAIEDAAGGRLAYGEIGEIVVRGDHTMAGYWHNEEATNEKRRPDGGVMTNDLGRFDENGFLRIVGRSRELIISGGFNVYPANVESRLGTIGGVRELVVFGVPHERWGEAVTLGVLTEDAGEPPAEVTRQIEDLMRDRLANFERPKAIIGLKEIPLTPVGKPDRAELARRYEPKARAALGL